MRNDATLPLGEECDKCNGYASTLEKSFLHHNRIWVPIMMKRVPGKEGKKRKRIGHIYANDKTQEFTFSVESKYVKVEGNIHKLYLPNLKEFNDLKFRRGLYHIAFNYLSWKLGASEALKEGYDPVRDFVRYGKSKTKWGYAQVTYPDDKIRTKLSISRVIDVPGFVVKLVSYIDDFYMDVLQSNEFPTWAKHNLPEHVLIH